MPKKYKPEPVPEPKITTSRSVKLSASHRDAKITLGHVADFVRVARERGYADDTEVSIHELSTSLFSDFSHHLREIRVGDNK